MIETPDIDSSTDDYANRFKGQTGKWMLETQAFATNLLLQNNKNRNILDIGGGHGQNIELLLRLGYNITIMGSDDTCKHRIQKNIDTNQVKFIKGNLLELPFEDNHFDVVISYRILTHMINWQDYIKELTRVSNKLVLIDFPSLRSANIIAKSLFKFKKKVEKNTRLYKVFKENDVIKQFKKLHYMPTQKYPQFFLPMAFHRLLKIKRISVIFEKIFRLTKMTYFFGSPIIYKFEKKHHENIS